MDDSDELMGIGAFARRVGLAPSALRFYDDCGVLPPARVDRVTGYRYYAPHQRERALLMRRLREAGMPLTDAAVVLDGTPEEARTILREHARKARDTADAARSLLDDVLRSLPGGVTRTVARLGGAELASAVRQVAPATAPASGREEFPVLGCVLVELDHDEVRLVATDRYRLSVRALRPRGVEGAPCRVLIDEGRARQLASWALGRPEVSLETDGRGVRLVDGGASLPVPTVEGTFPDYRAVLDALPAAPHRVVTDRAALRAAVAVAGAAAPGTPLTLRAGAGRLTPVWRGTAGAALPAVGHGDPVEVAFDPAALLPALDAGVGPDVLLEITAPDRPVVVRSADQGSFTTLVMPVAATAPVAATVPEATAAEVTSAGATAPTTTAPTTVAGTTARAAG
ncbi:MULTISPECIES: MerR family transcriptional regulator [Streptomyces]|uniref:MerR family transcriptional regulator n=1 Tax=Streptomyces changanensis TaxID=2964669 RepID=A0ABY5NE44_9ACTN|nr:MULTISPECIES: MerR family transcriptional regulator [Streptomyces]UUS34270.1 MerR family transcriptional regulator [Streptomyces changanensis]